MDNCLWRASRTDRDSSSPAVLHCDCAVLRLLLPLDLHTTVQPQAQETLRHAPYESRHCGYQRVFPTSFAWSAYRQPSTAQSRDQLVERRRDSRSGAAIAGRSWVCHTPNVKAISHSGFGHPNLVLIPHGVDDCPHKKVRKEELNLVGFIVGLTWKK